MNGSEMFGVLHHLGFCTTQNCCIKDVGNDSLLLQVQCPDQDKDATLLGDGQQCSGLCMATDANPCSCGTMSCPGCRSGFGYSGITDTSFLPDGCIFVGCTQGADPAKPTGTYYPFLIPGAQLMMLSVFAVVLSLPNHTLNFSL